MSSFAFRADFLTFFLMGFVAVLFGRNLFHVMGWRSVSAFLPDMLTMQQRVCALIAALLGICALLFSSSVLGVLALGGVMALRGMQGGAVGFWAGCVPLLAFYALYPSSWTALALILCLFWPLCTDKGGVHGQEGRLLSLLMALEIGFTLHDLGHATLWLLVVAGMLGVGILYTALQNPVRLLDNMVTLRPFLFLGVMNVARGNELSASAQAAFEALLLDLVLQFLSFLSPFWGTLRMMIPPLPGFLVLWLGLHAVLGLAAGTDGWSVVSMILVIFFAGMALLETDQVLRKLYTAPVPLRYWGWDTVVLALFLPSLIGVLGNVMSPMAGTLPSWEEWAQNLWLFMGGDGAVLALPLVWCVILPVWLMCVRPWKLSFIVVQKTTLKQFYNDAFMPWLALGRWEYSMAERSVVSFLVDAMPWRMRRFMVIVRLFLRRLRKVKIFWPGTVPDIGLVFWLLFLGGILTVMGLIL